MLLASYFFFPVAMGLANLLLLLVLIGWLFSGSWASKLDTLRSNPVALLAILLYLLIVAGALYSTAPGEDVALHLKKYLKLMLVPVAISLLLEERYQQWCLQAFVTAMLFVMFSTWANVWLLLPWSATQNLGFGVSHHVIGDHITQNLMMAFLVFICLNRCWDCFNAGTKMSAFAWMTLSLLGAISITHLSTGRTGYVGLLVVGGVFLMTRFRGRYVVIALIGLLLAGTAVYQTSEPLQKRVQQGIEELSTADSDKTSSIGHRLHNYRTTPELIAQKPILGWGTGAYHTAICSVLEASDSCETYSWHPHNQYLFFGADHGMLGMALYIGLLAAMVYMGAKDARPERGRLMIGLAALLAVNSLINSPLWSSRESHFFILMMALMAARPTADRTTRLTQETM